jgi:twinkle protein
MDLSKDDIKKYSRISDAQMKVRDTSYFVGDVLDRFLNGTHYTGIKLPFPQFDELFRLRDGELTVLAGINGAGKSMFAGQCMIHAMDQGYKCLSISLEMSPSSQVARMVRQCSVQKLPSQDAVLSFAGWSSEKLFFYDQHGSMDGRTLMSVIRYAKEVHDVDFVLVDSLMTLAMASDDWNGQKDIVCSLANCARNLDLHVMLVTHARKGNSIKDRLDKWSVAGSADITNRADNVIILGRLFEMDGADAYMSLAKARHFDGAEMDVDLRFDMDSLNFYLNGVYPQQIGMNMDKLGPTAGPTGDLHSVGLN